MSPKLKIAVDLMGTDKGTMAALSACLDFANKHEDLILTLIADHTTLTKVDHERIEKKVATNFIEQKDNILAIRHKPNSSMEMGMKLLKSKAVNVFLSAGNTSAFVTLAYNILGMLPGVKKPGFMPFIPSVKKGFYFNFLDVGASLECSGEDLVIFTKLASQFQKLVLEIPIPKVALLNVGTEPSKGPEWLQSAHQILLNESGIDYQGFIEPREILQGKVDLIVSDGYAGNMVLKSMEGTMLALSSVLKKNYKKPYNFLALLFSIGILKNVKKVFDYKNQAGALVLGVNGLLVKTHGSAAYSEFMSALQLAYRAAKKEMASKMELWMTSKNFLKN